jgi:hypothetical protein
MHEAFHIFCVRLRKPASANSFYFAMATQIEMRHADTSSFFLLFMSFPRLKSWPSWGIFYSISECAFASQFFVGDAAR